MEWAQTGIAELGSITFDIIDLIVSICVVSSGMLGFSLQLTAGVEVSIVTRLW